MLPEGLHFSEPDDIEREASRFFMKNPTKIAFLPILRYNGPRQGGESP